jgi:hypothetical protein
MYAVILNYESGQIDVLDLCNKPEDMDVEIFIEELLDYSLSNCEWMTVKERPHLNFLN